MSHVLEIFVFCLAECATQFILKECQSPSLNRVEISTNLTLVAPRKFGCTRGTAPYAFMFTATKFHSPLKPRQLAVGEPPHNFQCFLHTESLAPWEAALSTSCYQEFGCHSTTIFLLETPKPEFQAPSPTPNVHSPLPCFALLTRARASSFT